MYLPIGVDLKATQAFAKLLFLAWLPWLCLLTGLGATYAVWQDSRSDSWQAQQDRFDFYVAEVISDIKNRMRAYEQVLNGTVGLLASSATVERHEFKSYIESQRLEKNYPGIQGVGFALLLADHDVQGHMEQMRKKGFPDYRLHPAGERDIYTAIVHIEPFNWRNQRAFGYDMYADLARREAMQRAWESGSSTISGKVSLLQETNVDVQAGFLMYQPVYRFQHPHGTWEERRANLLGWAYMPFRMNDLMQGILRKHFGEQQVMLDLEIFDGTELLPEHLLYDSDAGRRIAAANSSYIATREIQMGGRTWTLLIDSRRQPDAPAKLTNIAIIGITGSLMLAALLWLLINGRRQAVKLAETISHDLIVGKQALQQALTELDDLYNYAPCGYHSLDERGHFVRINQTELDWLGYNSQEIIGKRFTELLAPDSLRVFQENYPRFKATGQVRDLEYELIRKDGSTFIVLLNATAIYGPDGRFIMTRSTLHDITLRKLAEDGLQRLNHLYALLNRANQAIVRIRNLDLLLEEICRVAVEEGGFVMAWAGRVVDGRVIPYAHWGREDGYLEQVRIIVSDRALGAGPTGTAIRQGQHYICDDIANDPHMAPWCAMALERGYRASAAFPVRVDGVVVGAINLYAPLPHFFSPAVIALLDDLTEDVSFAMNAHDEAERRMKAEDELRQLNEQLEYRVQQRTRELEMANKELESFSYSVSHDLRAPLRGIDGFSQILLKRYGEQLDDTGRDYLGRVRRASQRMGELIDDLLNLSRMTRSPLRRQEVDLSALAAALIQELQRGAPERQVKISIKPELRGFGDPGLLHVVLDNLLGNAWKFTRHVDPAEIEFGCQETDQEPVYFVRDNGAGFESAYGKKLFQVFQRLHSEAEFEGTGIGLATVHRIIQRHHGRVWATGASGQGASFFFTLPQRGELRAETENAHINEQEPTP